MLLTLISVHCNKESADSTTLKSGQVTLSIKGGAPITGEVLSGQTTLLAFMEQQKASGRLRFETIGSGEMTMLDSINGKKNEGAGDDRRNWLVSLNGRLAPAGIGQLKLEPGDRVVWCFIIWKERESCQ